MTAPSVRQGIAEALTVKQIRLLAELAERADAVPSDEMGLPGGGSFKTNKAEQNLLKRAAQALGHDGSTYRFDSREPLLHQSRGKWRFSPSGLVVARRAKLAMQSIEWLIDAATETETNSPLRYTCMPSHLIRFGKVLAPIDVGAADLVPEEVLPLHRADGGNRMATLINSGRVVLAIGPKELQVEPRIRRECLYRSSLRAVIGPESRAGNAARDENGHRTIGLHDLSKFRLATSPSGHHSRGQLEAAFVSAGLDFEVSIEVSDVPALVALSDGDTRVAVIPDDAVPAAQTRDWPVLIDSKGEMLQQEHWIYWLDPNELDGPAGGALEQLVKDLVEFQG